MTGGDGQGGSAVMASAPPAPDEVKASRLLATLGVGGVVAGVLLVVAFGLTLPTIEANKARELAAAVNEVLRAPARYETLYVVAGALVRKVPDGADPKKVERVYLGYRSDDQRVGFAMVSAEAGFQDFVRVIFGYDPRTKQLLGMKVLESKETPGLGDKIEKDRAFVSQFAEAHVPLIGVKQGKRSGPREVAMITGATISSKAVIRIINNALQRLGPLVDRYPQEGKG
ncbi:MAG: FMN-binding protein [Candidatus Rokubacteria bacterium]|nr:FMN-binding protein [Candidatus Rokubacteria bacterium]